MKCTLRGHVNDNNRCLLEMKLIFFKGHSLPSSALKYLLEYSVRKHSISAKECICVFRFVLRIESDFFKFNHLNIVTEVRCVKLIIVKFCLD